MSNSYNNNPLINSEVNSYDLPKMDIPELLDYACSSDADLESLYDRLSYEIPSNIEVFIAQAEVNGISQSFIERLANLY